MAPGKTRRGRKAPVPKRAELAYPIGTRLADGYNMDLDREAREGRPGDRLGMPPVEPPRPESGFRRGLTVVAYVALVILALEVIVVILGFPARFVRKQWRGMERSSISAPLAVTRHYADIRAAGRAGALADGWVPRFVPDGATDLVELHRASTGEGWLVFRFPPAEGRRMAERFGRVPADKLYWIVVGGPNEEWWPDSLQGRVALRKTGIAWEVFNTPRRKTGTRLAELMAIDWEHSRACLWREAR